MTPLQQILSTFRKASKTEREKGTYFEELIVTYLRHEPIYQDLYSHVWTYADWAQEQGRDARDTGIDLVAKTNGTDEYHAIQCKFYAEDYRTRYADNLKKELPRIPCVKTSKAFWAFSKAGRKLADLHINYETVDKYPVTLDTGSKNIKKLKPADYHVTKMKFAKKGEKETVIYNPHITIKDIPPKAYDYIVNGKPALEWIIERQSVTTHKDSGITNDANLYATETMNNPKYPLELFQRVITVSIETMKIVNKLPELDID